MRLARSVQILKIAVSMYKRAKFNIVESTKYQVVPRQFRRRPLAKNLPPALPRRRPISPLNAP